MTYNPATDFVGLWRAVAGGVQKEELPGLDFVVAALGRAGIISVSVSNIAPVVNQSTTAWFQPATPSYSAEGGLQLWNGTAYVAATPALLQQLLLNSVSTTRGALMVRGANTWQALAPGTLGYLLTSGGAGADLTWSTIGSIGGALDGLTNTVGALVFRGAGGWTGTGAGAINTLLVNTTANTPAWETLTAYMDAVFSSSRGSLFTRGAANWGALAPGATVGYPLQSNGAGADLSFAPSFVPFLRGTGANIAVLPTATNTGSTAAITAQSGMAFTTSGNNLVCDKTGVYLVTVGGKIVGDTTGAGYVGGFITIFQNGVSSGNLLSFESYFAGAITVNTYYGTVTAILPLTVGDTLGVQFYGGFTANQSVDTIRYSILRLA